MGAYLLVSGDFTRSGGMDQANYELAWHLAGQGHRVTLVSHSVAEPLASHPHVAWRRVERPLGRHALGEPMLAWQGRRWAAKLSREEARVLVNGGNCAWPDVNWVHALQAAWDCRIDHSPWPVRLRTRLVKSLHRWAERKALLRGSLLLTNSRLTRRQIIELVGIPEERVHAVYYGIDPALYRPPTPQEKSAARHRLGLAQGRPLVAFIGALGHDRNKGFDLLFSCWKELCRDSGWDADLAVAGGGAEVEYWKNEARALGLETRIRLLGFTRQIPDLLAASDALVSPTHYDSYGLVVQEALCCGLPAFVTRSAGVAERYPADLDGLLLDDPPEIRDLIHRLKAWRSDRTGARDRAAPFGAALRKRTWTDMSREIEALILTSRAKPA